VNGAKNLSFSKLKALKKRTLEQTHHIVQKFIQATERDSSKGNLLPMTEF
jgi:hypothetical protein